MSKLTGEVATLDWLNRLDEVAAFAKVHRRTIERALKRGELQALRAGGAVRITDEAVWAWLRRDPPSRRVSSKPGERNEIARDE